MVAVLGFSKEQIRAAVKEMYTTVANKPSMPLHFPVGGDACRLAGYSEEQMAILPDTALESFAGVGYPFRAEVIKPGDVVLDVGSGSGTDVLLSSSMVGDQGKVWALDLTPAMREKLDKTLKDKGISNVEILAGDAENIPLSDASVDVVTSNGVLNLIADKRRAIGEIFRVLKPGGHVQIADIVITSPVTPDCEDDPKLWAECVVGATVDETYLNMFRDAGFEEVEVLRDYDYFAHSPSKETQEVAKQFGAHSVELRMRRGEKAPAMIAQWARRMNPNRIVKNIQRRGLWGMLGLGMALLACYGTLALVGLLSVLGATMAINNTVWVGVIVLFAITTCAIIALGMRKHHSWRPVLVAVAGTALIIYTMMVNYSLIIEITGFLLLAVATYLDYDLRRWAKVPGGKQGSAEYRNINSVPDKASL